MKAVEPGRRARTKNRRVLMVAYFFPPVGGVPVPRVMALVRYLPRHGWLPVVLTPRNAGHLLRDEAGVARIPDGTVIVRTTIVEPGQLRRWLLRGTSDGSVVEESHASGQQASPARQVIRDAVSRSRHAIGSLGRAVFFPDEQIGWVPFGIVAGARAIRREHVDAIWSTSSPVSAHVIGGVLSVIGRRPWVADFRDPWVSTPAAQQRRPLKRWLMARVEAWILRTADHVTFATPRLTKDYASRYPDLADRFSTWTNGYDGPELEELITRGDPAAPRALGPFRLVHVGTLYRPTEVETFLAGVSLAFESGSLRPGDIRIEFIGGASAECIALIMDWSRSPGHEGVMDRRSYVPRAEALRTLVDADAALVLMGEGPGMDRMISVKLYEAIGVDRQVLAMAPPGDLRDVLEGLSWGVVVDPRPEAVAEGLREVVTSPPAARHVDPDGRYDRARIVADLARILDEVSGAPGARA